MLKCQNYKITDVDFRIQNWRTMKM